MTRKQFFEAISRTEYIFPFSGRTLTMYQLLYLPEENRLGGLIIEATSKLKAWNVFKEMKDFNGRSLAEVWKEM